MAGDGGPLWNASSGGDGGGPQGNVSGPGGAEQIVVPVLDVLILVLGVAGHTLVVLILCGRGRRGGAEPRGTVMGAAGTDVLLLALSAADLLLLATLPFQTVAVAMRRWPFGDALCRLVSFLGAASSNASAFVLATLALSRYLTVARPAAAYRLLTARRVATGAAALWLPACALAAPQLAFRVVAPPPHRAPDGVACFAALSRPGQLAYGACQFLLTFASPLVVIALAYGGVYCFLWRRRREGRAPQVERYQRKVTRTSAVLVVAFVVCWLPSYALMFSLLGGPESGATGSSPRYGAVSVWARLMATSSTVVNPIIYVLMSQKFRRDLVELLGCRRGGGGAAAAPGGVQTAV